jgi:hypothetical protein
MKANSKNRKLHFIRIKNAINLGKLHLHTSFKSSNIAELDNEKSIEFINAQAKSGWESIRRTWHLKWSPSKIEIKIGYNEDDFIKNISTIDIKHIK